MDDEHQYDLDTPICLYCRKENPPDVPFCVHCHQPLGAVASLGPIENEKYSMFKTFNISDPTERPITFFTLMILFGGCFIAFAIGMVNSIINAESILITLSYGILCAAVGSVLYFTARKYIKVRKDARRQDDRE